MGKIASDLYLSCDCGAETMCVQTDYEEIFLAIYRFKYSQANLWYRLRHCWHILTTGKPYEDEFVLDKKSAIKLAKWLLNVTSKMP